jgi:hypothetical protein
MRPITAAIAAAIITGSIVGGAALAIDEPATISACANNKTGSMRYLTSGSCKSSETALTWNQQGPKGDTGEAGESFAEELGTERLALTFGLTGEGCADGAARLVLVDRAGLPADAPLTFGTCVSPSTWGPTIFWSAALGVGVTSETRYRYIVDAGSGQAMAAFDDAAGPNAWLSCGPNGSVVELYAGVVVNCELAIQYGTASDLAQFSSSVFKSAPIFIYRSELGTP